VIKYHKANRSSTNQYFIGCSLYTFSTRHRYISGKPNIDEDLLKELFRNKGRISTIEVINLIFFQFYYFIINYNIYLFIYIG
jgi:hypothetical protein